ncbi:MAG: DNA polymerase III [Deltaproteobacteria bacterium HGW-Deltaproteobacteria-2]|jgi:DNA polymerase-3 subunit epsilon|nr:MAG: DNA polymerase III [Deltaproteobacteria bacterium HGW-Deltaproteobacteria-2]
METTQARTNKVAVNRGNLNFTAIDFETANYEKTSACQIGIVVVKNSEIVKTYSSYIKPSPNFFIPFFTELHNIDAGKVSKFPLFGELWREMSEYLTDSDILVAHNAIFDINVLMACCGKYGIEYKLPTSFCTCQAARRNLPHLSNHKLSTVCSHYGIDLNHHEALSDARAAALIALKLLG